MRRRASSRLEAPRVERRRDRRWAPGAGIALALATALIACGDPGAPPSSDAARSSAATRTQDDAPTAPRLLVVGWDGASFRRIDALLAARRLPNLAGLLARGVHGTLTSTLVPISSAAWTSAFSGKHPGETGVLGFFEPLPASYDVRLVDARRSLAAPLWRILSAHGQRSIVFGVPLTYPPEPILGTLVAGMLSPFDADYAWPPGLTDALRARGFEPDLESWTEARAPDADPDAPFDRLDRQLAIKGAVLDELLSRDDWHLAVVVFKSLDVFAHEAYGSDFATVVDPVYERLDERLGDLLERVGTDTNVLLLSDHGFRVYRAGVNLHAFLREAGFLAFTQEERVWPVDPGGTLAERERAALAGMRHALDWSRTRAYVQVTEGNTGALRLNLAGREPEGCVAPEEREAVLAELERALREARDAAGAPIFPRVWRTEAHYPGPGAARLPDLFVEARDDLQVFAEEASPRVVGPYGLPLPDHDRAGVLVAAGPSFRADAERRTLTIEDVAPTALHLLGLPVPREMTGAVWTELLLGDEAVRFVAEAELGLTLPEGRAFRPEELEELEARLGALGYGAARR